VSAGVREQLPDRVEPAPGPTDAADGGRRRGVVEALLVLLAAVFVVYKNDPDQLADLGGTVAGNLGDPLYFAWQLSWVGHAIADHVPDFWTTNAFLRTPGNLAFTDTILGYLPVSLLTGPGQAGALAALNIAGFFANVLALCGGYALARALGAGVLGSVVAGIGVGLAPWRVEQAIHLNVVSTGGIALTLALLAYGHGWSLRHGWRPERMHPWAVATGWGVACWQITVGFAIGVPFVYVLALVMALWGLGWLLGGRRRLPRRLLVADGVGGGVFLLVTGLLVQPYLRVLATNPASQRSEAMLPLFSPPWTGLRLSSDTSWFWGQRQLADRGTLFWPPEMIVSPGLVLAGLAVLGLFVSAWPLRRRFFLALATALATALTLGTQFWGGGSWTYLVLYRYLPGWDALRTPGRLIVWVTFGLALLAAGFLARLADMVAARMRRPDAEAVGRVAAAAGAAALVVPIGLVAADDWGGPRHWPVATAPVRVSSLPAPIMFLPSDQIGDYHLMLWTTDGFPTLANGNSGFNPPQQQQLRTATKTFPDAASVAALRAKGIRTVVVVRSRAAGTVWAKAADKPVAGLGIGRLDLGDAVVYALNTSR
jgi:hypothetical protein